MPTTRHRAVSAFMAIKMVDNKRKLVSIATGTIVEVHGELPGGSGLIEISIGEDRAAAFQRDITDRTELLE